MSDARTDITCKQSLQVQVLEIIESEIAYHGTSVEGPPAILAALAKAGLVIVPTTLLNKIPNEPPMSGKPQVTLEGSE